MAKKRVSKKLHLGFLAEAVKKARRSKKSHKKTSHKKKSHKKKSHKK